PVRTRGVKVPAHGIGGASSVKLKNFLVHPIKGAEVVSHSALFLAAHGSSRPRPVLIGLGVVLLAHSARGAVTINIPQHDATVFWGLIRAQERPGNAASAPESDVVAVTNAEREQVNLGALPPEAVARSLEYLEAIKCVEKIPGSSNRWRVSESYKIK